MAGRNNNLIPIQKGQLSKEESKRRSSNGGKKSVEVRRARKTLKEELLLLLSKGDTQEKISLSILEKALGGDVRAFEVIRDTIGEKPVDKVENINPPIAPLVISDKEKEDLNNFIVNSIKQNREENNND